MVRVLILPIAVFTAFAVVSHVVALHSLPGLIMGRAYDRMAEGGVPVHEFMLAPRATPQNQTVVRSSPDIAYSICRFDLSNGPVLVQGAAWDNYASLNVYDGRTDNVVAIDLGPEEPSMPGFLLRLKRDQSDETPAGVEVRELSTPRGVALIRRLAPSDEDYQRVRAVATRDVCRQL